MDEDGAHDPELIPSMIEKIESGNIDIVYAKFLYRKTDLKELSGVLAKRFIAFISREPKWRRTIYSIAFSLLVGSGWVVWGQESL